MKVQRLGLLVLATCALIVCAPVFAQDEDIQLTLPDIGNFSCSDLATLSLWLDDIQSNKTAQSVPANHSTDEKLLASYLDVFSLAKAWWNPLSIDILLKNGIFQKCASYKENAQFAQQEKLERQFLEFIVSYPCRPNSIEALRLTVLEEAHKKEEELSPWRGRGLQKLIRASQSPFTENRYESYDQLLMSLWLRRKNPLRHLPALQKKLAQLDRASAAPRTQRDQALSQAIVSFNRMVKSKFVRNQPDFKLNKESQINLLAGMADGVFDGDKANFQEMTMYFVQNTVGGFDSYALAHFPFANKRDLVKLKTPAQCIDFLAKAPKPPASEWLTFKASNILMAARANTLFPTPSDSLVIQGEGFEFYGGLLFTIDEKTRQFFRLPAHVSGYFLEAVNEGSLCHKWRLKAGDIVLEVNGNPLQDVRKTISFIDNELNKGTKELTFKIFRDDKTKTVRAKLNEDKNSSAPALYAGTSPLPIAIIIIILVSGIGVYARQKNKVPNVGEQGQTTKGDGEAQIDTKPSMSVLTSLSTLEEFFAPRYKKFRLLGKGGMGLVYRVSDGHLKRDVALKVISPLLVEDKEVKRRFLREVRALAALEHKGIVRVFDFGQEEIPFYTMEVVEGPSLRSLIDNDEITGDFQKVLDIAIELAEIIAYAHEQGVIHRDIKPSNVIMGSDGSLKLIDFGVAAMEGSTTITHSQAVVGTPAFFAPEVVVGASSSALSDQYSFGKVMYLLVGGSKAAEAAGTAFLGPPQPLAEVAPECPKELVAVIERCMATKPDQRFPSMSDVRSHL